MVLYFRYLRDVGLKGKNNSILRWSGSSPCFAAICGSVKWLYQEEPRVGWVRSLPLPGLSNTTPTTISVAFYALYGAYITFLSFEEQNRGMGAGFYPV